MPAPAAVERRRRREQAGEWRCGSSRRGSSMHARTDRGRRRRGSLTAGGWDEAHRHAAALAGHLFWGFFFSRGLGGRDRSVSPGRGGGTPDRPPPRLRQAAAQHSASTPAPPPPPPCLGGHSVHLANLVAPEAAAHGDEGQLGCDDGACQRKREGERETESGAAARRAGRAGRGGGGRSRPSASASTARRGTAGTAGHSAAHPGWRWPPPWPP